MQFSSPSINKVLTYNYIPDELKCDSNIIDNINKTFLQCKYYDNLSNLNICRKLSIIHFNARSIPKNFDSITDYLLYLKINFMIIVITESWLTTSNKHLFNIPNYSSEHIVRNNKRGGGVSIFINNNIKYKLIDNLSLSVNDAYDMITISFIYEHINYLLSGIYKAPIFNIIEFTDIIYNTFNRHLNKSLILTGDFNININNHNSHTSTKLFIDTLYSLNLIATITKPTHITNQTNSIIDNIYTNFLSLPLFNGVLLTDISDHLPIFCIFKKNINIKTKNSYKYIRDHSDQKYFKF